MWISRSASFYCPAHTLTDTTCLSSPPTHPQAQAAIAGGANVEVVDTSGERPLHVASKHGYIDVVRVLVQHGVDINSKGKCLPPSPLYLVVSCMLCDAVSGAARGRY